MSASAEAAKRRASDAQRLAARPEASVWVAASAGSGKTKVLTDRVLTLLLDGTDPARILCLTFTKAAAAEMANRLSERLGHWSIYDAEELSGDLAELLGRAPDQPLMARARRLFARVLDAPGGMKIHTIHAFCQSLLGRFPLEAGIAPHARVLDEREAAEMLEAAKAEVLSGAIRPGADGQSLAAAIDDITAHAQEQTFAELMAELLNARSRLQDFTARCGGIEGVVAEAFAALGVAPSDSRAGLLGEGCRDDAFDGPGLSRAAQAMAQGSKTDRVHGAAIARWLADPPGRTNGFESYLGAFFTKGGEGDVFDTLIYTAALALAPGSDAVLAAEVARLHALRARLRALDVARATAGLLRLGHAIIETYLRHKRARALLDYDDLILLARALLERPEVASWVLYKLDGGLDHVLIDEAQDTSPDQWKVVQSLTAEFFAGEGTREEPRTVFAVGDAKQSIYSFQRADPAAFERMRRHFAALAEAAQQSWENVPLEVSFRSTLPVLRAVDRVFARPEAQDGVRFGEESIAHVAVRHGQAGAMEVWPAADPIESEAPAAWRPPLHRDREAPPRTRLANLIAKRIHRWTLDPGAAHDPESRLASKRRRVRPGDILVLVRRRNEFVEDLVRALKRLDVPVAGVDRMVLSDQLAVMDLTALGRFLLLPEDDLTLATVLKGPLCGLTEDQLFALAHGRSGSLWAALRQHAADGDAAVSAARETLASLLSRADFTPPYELFAELLGPGRGRKKLLARLGPEAADPIEEFLALTLAYEQDHVPSLQGFLHWLEIGRQEVKRDMEHGHDVVRVMTVHGAKGLQAPIVFLPDTLQVPPAPRGLLWLDEAGGPPLWPLRRDYDGPAAKAARAAAARAQAQEYRRLLYVAMTRAEDRLYICGWNTKRAAPSESWYRLVERAFSEPELDQPGGEDRPQPMEFDFTGEIDGGWAGPGWRHAVPQRAAPEEEHQPPAGAARARDLPDWALRAAPREPAPPRPLVPSRPSESDVAVRSPVGPDQGRAYRRGRLIHRLLQSLPEMAPEARAAAGRRFLAAAEDLTAAEQDEILAETLAVLEDPAFAPLFGPASRAEVPLTGVVRGAGGEEVVSGQVDRLLVEDERVVIVDYKTNRPPPRNEAEVPALYLRQMAAYRTILSEIYPGRRLESYLLWTDGPRLMQLSDAALAGSAP